MNFLLDLPEQLPAPPAPTIPVVLHPAPVLLTPTERVCDFATDYLARLVKDMKTAMREHRGIGIAANQIGRTERVAVIAVPGWPQFVMVNPWIRREKGWSRQAEGCLSVPNVRVMVERSATVWVMYQDERGASRELKAKGLLARCIQHELDHLDGMTCLERSA